MTRELLTVGPGDAGKRLDAFVAEAVDGLSRSQAERLAKAGCVLVNAKAAAPGHRLEAGETVVVSRPELAPSEPSPEETPLDILFEDDSVIVVNKPRGMVVHPTANRRSGTLVNALLSHTCTLAEGRGVHRPGIVHRLDRDTSGLLVVAKTDAAYASLSEQLKKREVERRYLAIVWGNVEEDRLVIDVPIARHARDRIRMAAAAGQPEAKGLRAAHTDIAVLQRFGAMTLLEVRLGTGRTHQIRVHLGHVGHPVVGDPVYGRRQARRREATLSADTLALVRQLRGQALHAQHLAFRHPATGQRLSFSASMPAQMARLLSHLSQAPEPNV